MQRGKRLSRGLSGEVRGMGVFKVEASVWRVGEYDKRIRGELTVDAEATYTVIPEGALRDLGVEPIRAAKLRLADGRVVERPLGEVGVEIEEWRASATLVLFGPGDISLLGSVTMEQLGLAPDPIAKRLKPVEAYLL